VAASAAETDPSVCYRHPDRSSWTLCARCGRTICPECQILTPSGVRCPDCVREAGGSVRWEPAAGAKPARAKKSMRRRPRTEDLASRVSASTYPVVTIGIAALAVVLWIAGFVTGDLPNRLLAASPEVAWQVWRYVTSPIAFPAVGGAVLFVVLSIAIFVYIGWSAERLLGRRRFFGLFLVTGAATAAFCMVAGSGASGLFGPIWGMAGAYLIMAWGQPAARNRILISIAVWLIISIFLSGSVLSIIGGTLSGVGAMLLLRRYEDRSGVKPSRPWLLLAGGVGVLIVLAILRNAVLA
jgi:membrane associated rhomboid family serine protease